MLLRNVAQTFIAQTDDGKPISLHESAKLRNEVDSLISIYELGHIDPVEVLLAAPLPQADVFDPAEVPLTGTHG